MLLGGLLLVVLVVGALWVVSAFRSYLSSDELRQELQSRLSSQLGGPEVEITPLAWSGSHLRVSRVDVREEDKAEVGLHSLQAAFDWSGLRDRTVHVTELRVDSVEARFASLGAPGGTGETPSKTALNEVALPEAAAGWRSWLPNRLQVDHVTVARLDVRQSRGRYPLSLVEARLEAEPAAGEKAWNVKLRDAELKIGKGEHGAFDLRSTNLRADGAKLFINDAQAGWMGDSDVSARGFVEFATGKVDLAGKVNDLDILKLVGESWRGKLSGLVKGDFHLSLEPGAPMTVRGHASVKGGVLQCLPVLDKIATYTRASRFRRLPLDVAEADYRWSPGSIVLRELVLQSSGLIRVEGNVTVQNGSLSGMLHVGVTPDTLKWIPGAERRVFVKAAPSTDSPAGYVWASLRLGGTTSAPTEDLSARLVAGVGEELLLAPVETATQVLEGVGTQPLDKTGADVIKGAGETLKSGIDTGAGLLRGLLPGGN
jgi:hypothetical protein